MLFDKMASVYFIEKYTNILALKMANPRRTFVPYICWYLMTGTQLK